MAKMRMVKITQVEEECIHTKTIRFRYDSPASPGQFVMVWIPGVDEIPMSLSYVGLEKGITVHRIGEATEALHELRIGDAIGIRGPLGRPYRLEGNRLLLVGGGTGIASLLPAAEIAKSLKKHITIVIGAKSAEELIFVPRAEAVADLLKVSTDDGTAGYHGFASELAKKLMAESGFDQVLTCGPESMMKSVIRESISRNMAVQASFERFMRCGIGICGSCAFGKLRICKDGPVFDGQAVLRVDDLDNYRRDPSGRKIPLV